MREDGGRQRGLTSPAGNVEYALLTVTEQPEDPDPGRISKKTEELGDSPELVHAGKGLPDKENVFLIRMLMC